VEEEEEEEGLCYHQEEVLYYHQEDRCYHQDLQVDLQNLEKVRPKLRAFEHAGLQLNQN
jgi:hypothetical protein